MYKQQENTALFQAIQRLHMQIPRWRQHLDVAGFQMSPLGHRGVYGGPTPFRGGDANGLDPSPNECNSMDKAVLKAIADDMRAVLGELDAALKEPVNPSADTTKG